MDPVTVEVLADLVAGRVVAASDRVWKKLRGSPEGRAVRQSVTAALNDALAAAVWGDGASAGDESWAAQVSAEWQQAFNKAVVASLVGCLADSSDDAAARFAEQTKAALRDSGCDMASLGRAFWVDEFLAQLPRCLFAELSAASLRDEGVRSLVGHLLALREDERARGNVPASPAEFRSDLMSLLDRLEARARKKGLPAYLDGADTAELSREVRVRLGVRPGVASGQAEGVYAGAARHLATEWPGGSGPPISWPEAAADSNCLMVLADPGLGKSWLIRSETRRLCHAASDLLADGDRGGVIFPVPLRCDQLAQEHGRDLAEKAAEYLVGQRLLPRRSCVELAEKIRRGKAVLLLDALDETTPADDHQVRTDLREWADQADGQARCVIASRISGYAGSPLPGAREVELQPFSREDVVEVVNSWGLPTATAARLRHRLEDDPAIAAMARIPLLLALICRLAASPGENGNDLPRTRGELLDRVLRSFMSRSYRSPNDRGNRLVLDGIGFDRLAELLGPVAFAFANQPEGWTDLMPQDRLLEALREAGTPFDQAHDVLRELTLHAEILVPAGDPSEARSPAYLFIHRAVAEYLVAGYLANLLPEDRWLAIAERHRWSDPDWAEAIPMLGERLDKSSARTLIKHLSAADDPFHHSLLTAARVWGARRDANHLLPAAEAETLAERLTALIRHPLTREASARALAAMPYLPQPLLPRLKGLASDSDSQIRAAAAWALANKNMPEATSILLGLLSDPQPDLRRDVAEIALAGRDGPDVTKALIGLADDPEDPVREAAVRAMAGRPDPEVTRRLLDLAGDPERPIRKAAVGALAGRDGPEVTRCLLDLLSDPAESESVRLQVATILTGRDGPDVTCGLLDLACSSSDMSVMWLLVVRVMDRRPGSEVASAIMSQASDPRPEMRRTVAWFLEGRDDPGVTRCLVELSTDAEGSVREAAIDVLAYRDGPEVTRWLLDLAGNPDDHGRMHAARALESRASMHAARQMRHGSDEA